MAFRVGFGSVLTVATTTGGHTAIGQIKSFDGPNGSGTDVDTTVLDTATNYRTFTRGPVDPGEVNITVAYDPALASHAQLGTLYDTGETDTFTIFYGSSTGGAVNTSQFSAYVSSLSRSNPLDDLITVDVTLKVSGDPQYTST